ncbi:MAG: STAS domain-containing protein [Spirochaetes bacterium]|nr:STAS domain-containing protein [Spirochaetota bacterium]
MNFTHNSYADVIILTITGIGEYGDDVKLIKYIEKLLPEKISTVAINFSQVDTINSAAVAAIINLLKFGDNHNFDVVFFGANDKIYMILERALPKYAINIFTEDELYKRYNINI